jgi:hypothetical protein
MSYKRLAVLRGTGIPHCGTATLNLTLPGMQLRAVKPNVILLEQILNAISLRDITARPELAKFTLPYLAKSPSSSSRGRESFTTI